MTTSKLPSQSYRALSRYSIFYTRVCRSSQPYRAHSDRTTPTLPVVIARVREKWYGENRTNRTGDYLVLGQSLMDIPIHIYPVIMQKCLPFIMYCEICCQVNCLQTCEHMNAYWAIKAYIFVKFHIHIYILGCLKY